MRPLATHPLRRSLCVLSNARTAACPHTLHPPAPRRPPETLRHSYHQLAVPHDSLSDGPPPLCMFTANHTEPSPPDEISDLEWEIRTGRAIYILERTLPDFFQVGLVSSIDSTRPDILDGAVSESGQAEGIYSPTIRLTYTPPVALPPPFPRTLSLEGLALYTASSVFIRHAMKTLCSDLHVEMRKLMVHTPAQAGRTPSRRRDKSVLVGLTVRGTTRVSGGQGEWQIDSTYGFSPASGLINVHTVDSIQPAPHQAAYDALQASLSRVFGIGGDIKPAR